MVRRGKLVTTIAAFLFVWLANSSAMASTFLGELPVGYSDSVFQISGGASSLVIDINAFGSRDPATCSSCNSSYADSYTVNLFDRTGALLESANEINYLYYNMYSSSHGIGAGPIGITIPAGATTLEIVSRLSVARLLGPDGHPLSFGNLNISTDGSITAATPIPSTLSLLATGLAALALLGWHISRRQAPFPHPPNLQVKRNSADRGNHQVSRRYSYGAFSNRQILKLLAGFQVRDDPFGPLTPP